jgi:stearoyl-CoA desaturase (delta-9 desaturase)
VLLGIKQVAVVGFFETCLYRYRSFAPKLEIETYGAGVKEDWLERNVYIHQRLGLLLMLIINILLFGRIGLLIWLVQVIWTPLWSNSVITGLAHWRFGYRHPDAKDNSRNFPGLGFFIIGDQLHSNHHADPASPKLSQKWYEFDLGWFYIRILRALGLAKTRDSV